MRAGAQRLGLAGLLLTAGCGERLADEVIDVEAIKVEACGGFCDMIETCEVDLSAYIDPGEPTDCFERCMTLVPRLHEDNQCGSREIIGLRCLGALDCEGYAAHRAGFPDPTDPSSGRDWSAPCMPETGLGCSIYEPFDLEEESPTPDSWP